MQQVCHQIVAAAAIVNRFCTNSLGHVPQGSAVHAGMVACGKTQTTDGTLSVIQQASREEQGAHPRRA